MNTQTNIANRTGMLTNPTKLSASEDLTGGGTTNNKTSQGQGGGLETGTSATWWFKLVFFISSSANGRSSRHVSFQYLGDRGSTNGNIYSYLTKTVVLVVSTAGHSNIME